MEWLKVEISDMKREIRDMKSDISDMMESILGILRAHFREANYLLREPQDTRI